LPAAKIHIRFLIPELLNDGNPAQDFFHLLGLPEDKYNLENEPRNPSLDVSILHALSKNPHAFSGVHDNSLMLALTRTLSKKFRSKNVQMLRLNKRPGSKNVFVKKISGYQRRIAAGLMSIASIKLTSCHKKRKPDTRT
jgi:hypothetical protein